jgi:hypothetical protein
MRVMKAKQASVADRRHTAHAALEELRGGRSESLRLEVLCANSHRVAAVYDTPAGLVYATMTGPHAHGSRDFVGTEQYHGCRGKEYTDLLRGDAQVDDALPAWCGCGPRTLSRAELAAAVADYRKHLHVT